MPAYSKNTTAAASGQRLPPSSEGTPPSSTTGSTSEQETGVERSIAAELQRIFNKIFVNHEKDATHPIDNAFITFANKNENDNDVPKNPASPAYCTMSYEGLFFVIAQEFVELVALRFGDLGCDYLEASQSRYMITCLTHDKTNSMFDSVMDPGTPFIGYNNPQTVQTIEVWFSSHPLSFILSKTILLRSLRNNTCDKILLAVILADVNCAQEDEQARSGGQEMFRWVQYHLHVRSIEDATLPNVQALVILGWHELCASRARRAVCYLGLAGCLINELPQQEVDLNLVNGVDVGEVQLEMICNVHWLVFSITLWALMQIDSHVSELLPATAPTSFPPVDESASALFKLDKASDNLSTLPNQARMFRELWPLSHIASTAAHIYALYPRKPNIEETSQLSSWQDRTLHQLRHLSSVGQDISLLCTKIRHVLINAIELIQTHVENRLSQALVLSAYHTMIIHLLFPRLDNGSEVVPLSNRLIGDILASAQALLKIFSVVDRPADSSRVVMGFRPSSIADVFALGLDACGRAFDRVYDCCIKGSEAEKRAISERAGDLLELATALHSFSKHPKLLPSTRATKVKKKLKYVMRNLERTRLESVLFGNAIVSSTRSENVSNGTISSASTVYPFFNPFVPQESGWDLMGNGMLYSTGATDMNGPLPFGRNTNVSQHSSEREEGSHEALAFLDTMQFGELAAGGASFDLSLPSASMDYVTTSASEVYERRAGTDPSSSNFPG
ncbi:hypothetical protein MMC17_000596 [Xylographa soralifera]|nr:hypothetical protein [Xylographa soralifera]